MHTVGWLHKHGVLLVLLPNVCHTLTGHLCESVLHARDAKTVLRAQTEKLKLRREAEIKMKPFRHHVW